MSDQAVMAINFRKWGAVMGARGSWVLAGFRLHLCGDMMFLLYKSELHICSVGTGKGLLLSSEG